MDIRDGRNHLNRFQHHIPFFDYAVMYSNDQILLFLEMVGEVAKADVQFGSKIAHSHAHKTFSIEKLHGSADDAILGR